MPELPEVESAVQRLRSAVSGRVIQDIRLLHPALERRISPATLRAMRGARVASVERRGKHQLMTFDDGRILHAHFRMTGDWLMGATSDELPRHSRAVIDFTDGTRVVLEDPRMLATMDLHAANVELDLGLGPEPSDPTLTAESLHAVLTKKRTPIKPVLLDQRVIAGLGNIYAAESLWHAKIAPTTNAATLTVAQLRKLLVAIRKVIAQATGARYTDSSVSRLAVYDRVGKPCRRCGTPIERIAQAGRSTYFCPFCQREESASDSPRDRLKQSSRKSKKKMSTRVKTRVKEQPAATAATLPARKAARKGNERSVKRATKRTASVKSVSKSSSKSSKSAARKSTVTSAQPTASRGLRAKRP